MALPIAETNGRRDFSPDGVRVAPLLDTDRVRMLLVNLDAGQSVAPCQMPCTVLYYIIEGQGCLRMGDEQAELRTGSLVVVPAGAVRAIAAAEQMRVLAVQVL